MGAEPVSDGPSAARIGLGLSVALGIGLALRLIGVTFGLPAVYNPDEVAIMSRTLALAKGDLNPHNFVYPSFFFYALAAWIGGYVALALAAGQASFESIQSQFFRDPTHIYLVGRLLSVISGTLSVAATYILASRISDRTAGMAAAAFLAVAPIPVRDAHYVKHDVPVTLLTVLALLAIGRLLDVRAQRGRDLVIAAALVGAAASTHYYLVFLVVPLTLAILIADRFNGPAERTRAVTLAAVICVAAFLVLSPFILLDWNTALRDILANRRIVIDRAAAGGGMLDGLVTYLDMLWRDAAGWPVALLAIAGAFDLTLRSPTRSLVWLSFPAVFLLFLAKTVPASRYLNPILPIVTTCAGVAVSRLTDATPVRFRQAAVVVVILAACLPGFVVSWRTDQLFRQDDTRTLARRYIETHVSAGSTILIQPYSADLRPSRESLMESLRANGVAPAAMPVKVRQELALEPYPEPSYRLLYLGDGGRDSDKIYVQYSELGGPSLERLRQLGVQYLVVTRYRTPQPSTRPFLAALASDAQLLAAYSPYPADLPAEVRNRVEPFLHNTNARPDANLGRPGPVIEIWRLIKPTEE